MKTWRYEYSIWGWGTIACGLSDWIKVWLFSQGGRGRVERERERERKRKREAGWGLGAVEWLP